MSLTIRRPLVAHTGRGPPQGPAQSARSTPGGPYWVTISRSRGADEIPFLQHIHVVSTQRGHQRAVAFFSAGITRHVGEHRGAKQVVAAGFMNASVIGRSVTWRSRRRTNGTVVLDRMGQSGMRTNNAPRQTDSQMPNHQQRHSGGEPARQGEDLPLKVTYAQTAFRVAQIGVGGPPGRYIPCTRRPRRYPDLPVGPHATYL